MRKSSFTLAMIIAVILTMVVPAIAADLHPPHQGQNAGYFDDGVDCKSDEIGVWHFVANQHKSDSEVLVLKLGSDTITTDEAYIEGVGDGKVTKGSAHWWVEGPTSLKGIDVSSHELDGSALPGKLVVSDAYCTKKD